MNVRSGKDFDTELIYERIVDVAAERERLTKDLAKHEKGLLASERQLGNEAFMAKAPAHIVEGLKKQAAETRLLYEKARATLDGLATSRVRNLAHAQDWRAELKRGRLRNLDAPGWLWSGVVELVAVRPPAWSAAASTPMPERKVRSTPLS